MSEPDAGPGLAEQLVLVVVVVVQSLPVQLVDDVPDAEIFAVRTPFS